MYHNLYPNDYESEHNHNTTPGNQTDAYRTQQQTGQSAQQSQQTSSQQTASQPVWDTQQPRGVYSGYMPMNSKPSAAPPEKKKKERKAAAFWKKTLAVAMAGILFGVCAAGSFYAVTCVANLTADETQALETNTEGHTEIPADTVKASANSVVTTVVTDVTDVVEKVMPSAVSITGSYTVVGQTFFGERYEMEEEGSGSGIIVGQNDTELLIVTNSHVIADANTLQVQFIDGETVKAQLKGNDATMDLAVIAVNLSDIAESTLNSISIAKMGDSSSIKIGEPAIAIGNSLGYGQSVTKGVISALDREISVEGEKLGTTLIQTDAAINPGNSGGALVNIDGEVIGINSVKIGDTIIEGMGYAIPISAAKPIIETLMSKETRSKVSDEERGYLGIRGANITSEITEVYDGMPKGVYIVAVTSGSGAERAGLMKGNIITKMEGVSVAKIEELNKMLSYYRAGDTVTLTIAEGSPEGYQEKEVSVTLSSAQTIMQQE